MCIRDRREEEEEEGGRMGHEEEGWRGCTGIAYGGISGDVWAYGMVLGGYQGQVCGPDYHQGGGVGRTTDACVLYRLRAEGLGLTGLGFRGGGVGRTADAERAFRARAPLPHC
eukprot:3543437-Rhodomonas_salina.1